MSFSLIYAKTPKGVEEVRTRAGKLSATARRVLIMVDGKRDENELRLVVRDGELEGVLAGLVAQGLIEECGLAELPERDWDDEADATVAMEATGLRLDLGLGAGVLPPRAAPATAAAAPPPSAPSALPPAPSAAPSAVARAAAPPPPTLRMAIEEADRRALAQPAVAARPPAPTTIVIKPVRVRTAPEAPPDPEAAGAALEEAKRAAVRALYERLGPYGEEPAARINDCKSHEALREQIRHACRRITTFRGEPAARDYLAAIGMG